MTRSFEPQSLMCEIMQEYCSVEQEVPQSGRTWSNCKRVHVLAQDLRDLAQRAAAVCG